MSEDTKYAVLAARLLRSRLAGPGSTRPPRTLSRDAAISTIASAMAKKARRRRARVVLLCVLSAGSLVLALLLLAARGLLAE